MAIRLVWCRIKIELKIRDLLGDWAVYFIVPPPLVTWELSPLAPPIDKIIKASMLGHVGSG